jgi:predicted porin
VGGRFGYTKGPLDVAAAYGESTIASDYFAGTTTKVRTFSLGASYDLGSVKFFGEASRVRRRTDYEVLPVTVTPDRDIGGYLLGVTVPVGPGLIRAAYSRARYDDHVVTPARPSADVLALGYVHNLSRRTALYATISRLSNRNGASLSVGGPAFATAGGFTPKTSSGYDIGIRHAF